VYILVCVGVMPGIPRKGFKLASLGGPFGWQSFHERRVPELLEDGGLVDYGRSKPDSTRFGKASDL
jgi:hypothetical protein